MRSKALGYRLQALVIFLFLLVPSALCLVPSSVQAIYDPLSVPNNKVGIHILSSSPQDSSPAASLVNSSGGDWGYVTVLIEDQDLNQDKWQNFYNDLRRRHLIPLLRLATHSQGNNWVRPSKEQAQTWANFLDQLNWPTKNKYVIVYNEPDHA